jgi:hypothetical protein
MQKDYVSPTLPLYYKASLDPLAAIRVIAYAGQPEKMRRYRNGYEYYFNSLPILNPSDPLFEQKVKHSGEVLAQLGVCLQKWGSWFPEVRANEFARTILAIEDPTIEPSGLKEGAEIIVAHWGKGFTSPIHGHTAGLHYEDLIEGKFLTHSYRQIDDMSNTVRLVRSELVDKRGPFVSRYEKARATTPFPRHLMVHNFTAIETSHSLHYLGEHSRDGMGNTFTPEYFEDVHSLQLAHLKPITPQEGIYLPIGSVVLVRSANVPDYGDHYIVITGRPINKPHGLRPQDEVISAPNARRLLDVYSYPAAHFAEMEELKSIWEAAQLPDYSGRSVTLLQLNKEKTREFHQFHGIQVDGDTVKFPED